MICIRCGNASTISVCMVLSTKGRKPRLQKSSKALQFCSACLDESNPGKDRKVWPAVREALHGAYTALKQA